jgi:hypothetical protein
MCCLRPLHDLIDTAYKYTKCGIACYVILNSDRPACLLTQLSSKDRLVSSLVTKAHEMGINLGKMASR